MAKKLDDSSATKHARWFPRWIAYIGDQKGKKLDDSAAIKQDGFEGRIHIQELKMTDMHDMACNWFLERQGKLLMAKIERSSIRA